MTKLLVISFLFCVIELSSQTYLHPTTGIAGEYVGSCQTSTCSGIYYDSGGAAGNYTNNVAGTYRIFCPNAPGQCLTATFSQFNVEYEINCLWDIFIVTNGSTQNSPIMYQGCGAGIIGPFTGTNNGCLGFRFFSDFTVMRPGWAATFSCAPCAGAPTGLTNNDCPNATLLCASAAVPGNSTGPGISAEACGGAAGCPAGGENYSNWYAVTFTSSGTFNFTIVPQVTTDDYDYAVYGPNVGCNALGASVRCSDSGTTGITGLLATALDFSESVFGDKFTSTMNVLAGQTYYIMVDEWTPTGAGYNLNFSGTAAMGCILTPVEFSSFETNYRQSDKSIGLIWTTASEMNNDYFAVERSVDGDVFEQIDAINGAGNSAQTNTYYSRDAHPYPGEINYYRIKQVDTNGKFSFSSMEAVAINDPESHFSVYPNPTKNEGMITYTTARNGEVCVLKIYDSMAKLVLNYRFTGVKGINQIPLNMSGFVNGVYFLTLQNESGMLRTSMVKE